jgi:hypothetical protein
MIAAAASGMERGDRQWTRRAVTRSSEGLEQTLILESVWHGVCTYVQEPALQVFSDAVCSFERGAYVDSVFMNRQFIPCSVTTSTL